MKGTFGDPHCDNLVGFLDVNSVQFSSVSQSCPTLCDPMDCSTPGFPVLHQLPELAQTHVYRAGDAIQPPHPLSNPSPPKYWSFSFSISPSNEYSGMIPFRTDWLDLLQSKRLSRVFSNTTVQKHQFFGTQSNSHIHT